MKRQRPLRIDPIAEAKRQWTQHGWEEAAPGMAVYASIMRVHQLMLSDVEQVLKPMNLSFARFELLRLLAFTREGRMPMSSAVSRLQVHPASVTSIVDRLMLDGLASRESHPSDGRATMLVITESGKALVEKATLALNAESFEPIDMTPADQSSLIGILARYRKDSGDFEDPAPKPESLEAL
ncbi:MAG TPA: MarR family transcriptional regulator [Actinomyces sp.]|nr:MarR family transcriptional regulator [Actinomyces sp.]